MILLLFLTQLYAVEGYKNLKFGMTKDEVMKSGLCTFTDIIKDKEQPYLESIKCTDLKMNGKNTTAFAYFIENKFLRIGIGFDIKDASAITNLIVKKYGYRTSPKGDLHLEKKVIIPNNSTWIGFDNDTVFMLFETDNLLNITPYLVYTSPLFNELILERKKIGFADDI